MEILKGWTPLEKLTPHPEGAGVFVCEPVARNADSATANLASASGRWLQMVLADQPELGQTPVLPSAWRVERQMKRTDLRLTPDEGVVLGRALGLTHVATGVISGSAERCTLTYTLRTLPAREAVGETIVLTGSAAELLKGLPAAAGTLAGRLGVKQPRLPKPSGLTDQEMAFLGGLHWFGDRLLEGGDAQKLDALAERDPLAGLMQLQRGGTDAKKLTVQVDRLMAQLPDSPVVYATAGTVSPGRLEPHAGALDRLLHEHPANFQLLRAAQFLQRRRKCWALAREMAERGVRAAPSNPDAWLGLGSDSADAAAAVRWARIWSDLTEAEGEALSAAYDAWLETVGKAVELDGEYGKAWLRVALAATFDSEEQLADEAFKKAAALSESQDESLQLQPEVG